MRSPVQFRSVQTAIVDQPPRSHGSLSDFPGFYGIAGLVAGAVLIFGAKLLGMILNRPEDYYGE
jgi:hypothetical protein